MLATKKKKKKAFSIKKSDKKGSKHVNAGPFPLVKLLSCYQNTLALRIPSFKQNKTIYVFTSDPCPMSPSYKLPVLTNTLPTA